MTSAQLQLIATDGSWKLDKRTVEVGRAGVAQARAALAAATALKEEFIVPEHGEQEAKTPDVPARPTPRYIAQTLTGASLFDHQAAA